MAIRPRSPCRQSHISQMTAPARAAWRSFHRAPRWLPCASKPAACRGTDPSQARNDTRSFRARRYAPCCHCEEADAAIRPRSPCQKLYISYWSFSKTQTKQQALPGRQYIWQKDKREFVEPPTGATTSSDLASLGHFPLKGKALGVPRCQKPSPSGEGGAKRRMRS